MKLSVGDLLLMINREHITSIVTWAPGGSCEDAIVQKIARARDRMVAAKKTAPIAAFGFLKHSHEKQYLMTNYAEAKAWPLQLKEADQLIVVEKEHVRNYAPV